MAGRTVAVYTLVRIDEWAPCDLSHQGYFLQTASFHLLYLWLPGKSCVLLHTKEGGGVCLGHDLITSAAVSSVTLRWKRRRECCLFAPVLSLLVDTNDGYLDPVGCSGGVIRYISDCQVVGI